jgi:hypothetical protein
MYSQKVDPSMERDLIFSTTYQNPTLFYRHLDWRGGDNHSDKIWEICVLLHFGSSTDYSVVVI